MTTREINVTVTRRYTSVTFNFPITTRLISLCLKLLTRTGHAFHGLGLQLVFSSFNSSAMFWN